MNDYYRRSPKRSPTKQRLLSKQIGDVTLSGNYDVDKRLLEYLDIKTLAKLEQTNKYAKGILDDQNFWKERLRYRLGLTTKLKNFNYKHAAKFLDNGYSLGTNLAKARYLRDKNIIKLLEENGVKAAPDNLLGSIKETLYMLAELGQEPYDIFKSSVAGLRSPDAVVHTGDLIYHYKQLDVYLTIESSGDLTEGEILYDIAKALPDDDDIYQVFGDHIYFEGLSVEPEGTYKIDLGS